MKTQKYIYGWYSTDLFPFFVYQDGIHWGVTTYPENAAVFTSIEKCIEHYKSKHAIPENYPGNHLVFFDSITFIPISK